MRIARKLAASLVLNAFVLSIILLVTSCQAAPSNNTTTTKATTTTTRKTTIPKADHIVIVVEENRSYNDIVGNPDAPYINSLAHEGANFTNAHAETHPSQPNYLALFSGSTQGVTDDSCPHTFSKDNLGAQLFAKHLGFTGYSESMPFNGFTGYSESMPFNGFTGCQSGPYARKHNPWVNFTNVPASSNRTFKAFPGGSNNFGKLPKVSFVIPNLDNDMHDGTIAEGDTWLRNRMDSYARWAKTHNSLLILTFDEDANNTPSNQIATVIVGQKIKPGNYSDSISHYNLLRTIEDMYGLRHAGSATTARPITNIWRN